MVDFLDLYGNNNDSNNATDLYLDFGYDYLWDLDIDYGDEDWFRFDLDGTEQQSSNGAYIFFDHFFGDLDLALYSADDTENPIDTSTSTEHEEFISFQGLGLGTYYLRVYGFDGQSNPYYDLDVFASVGNSDSTSDGDDSFNSATFLDLSDTLNFGFGFDSEYGLEITENDQDWFEFTLDGTQQLPFDGASIFFDHFLGDLDLALYSADDTENPIGTSTSTEHEEFISFEGLGLGTYYLRVYGFDGQTNPYYDLEVFASVAFDSGSGGGSGNDRFDNNGGNNNFDNATPLLLENDEGTQPNLIITSGDEDWFRFVVPSNVESNARAEINFDSFVGDLDLELYNSNRDWIYSSAGIGDNETIDLSWLAAGEYYLQVYGFSGAENYYDLDISANAVNTQEDAGDSPGEAQTITDLGRSYTGLIEENDADWYLFTLPQLGGIGDEVRIDFTHSSGDLDITLYDADDTSFIDSSLTVTDNESISLAGLTQGDYLIEVEGYDGATNDYQLIVDVAGSDSGSEGGGNSNIGEPGDEFSEAQEIINLGQTISEQEITEGDEDWFKFTLPSTGTAQDGILLEIGNTSNDFYYDPFYYDPFYYDPFYYDPFYYDPFYYDPFYYEDFGFGNSGDLDLELYNDRNEQINFSFNGGTEDEYISLESLPQGEYYIRVSGYEGATNNYYLTIDVPATEGDDRNDDNDGDDIYDDGDGNDSLETAANFGTFESKSIPNLVIQAGDNDWYRFNLPQVGAIGDEVRINFEHNNGEGDLDLILRDSSGDELESSKGIDDSETVSLEGRPAGDYYVEVVGFNNAANPNYTLQFISSQVQAQTAPDEGDQFEPNNTLETATNLTGDRRLTSIPNLSIHEPGDIDFFQFDFQGEYGGAGDRITISFDESEADLDLAIYDALGNLLSASTGVTGTETISLEGCLPDTYFVEVYSYDGRTTNYTLDLSIPGDDTRIELPPDELAPDRYEANDSQDDPTNLGTLGVRSGLNETDLSIHEPNNSDFFTFTTSAAGNVQISVNNFDHDLGDIDLRVFNEDRSFDVSSQSTSDTEVVVIPNAPGDSTYFVEVFGYSGATNPEYDLDIVAFSSTSNPENSNPENSNNTLQDRYEDNNSFDTATLIRNLDAVLGGLNIHQSDDKDFFQFSIGEEGAASSDRIAIEFDNNQGDLGLMLYNSEREEIRTSTTPGVNREAISLDGLGAGEYYIEVSGAVNPNYELILDADNNSTNPSSSLDEWTIMVYMNGDNQLQSAALEDINEMEAVPGLPDNVNVVVQVDGSEGEWAETRRGVIQEDNNPFSISSNLTSIGEQNMGDGATLTEFVRWGAENYTAQNYAVVIWDQGGGLDGLLGDQTSQNRSLTISEIGFAFDEANLGDELKFIGFDAGLMGLAEVGYEMSQYIAEDGVFVGSQQIEPEEGWDYTGWLRQLAESGGNLDAEELGSAVVDTYDQAYSGSQTQSAIRANQYQTLKDAVNAFANAVTTSNSNNELQSEDWDNILQARNSAKEHDWFFPNQRDLLGFMEGVKDNINETITEAAEAVIDVIGELNQDDLINTNGSTTAVINQVNNLGYGGIGIYLPASNSPIREDYTREEFSFLEGNAWVDFVELMIDPNLRTQGERLAVRDYTEDITREGSRISGIIGSRNTPYQLGTLDVSTTYNDLSIHSEDDQDWFGLELPTNGTSDYSVEISSQEAGNLNLALYNIDNPRTPIIPSDQAETNNRTISFDGLSEGNYLLQVSGEVNPEYTLELNAPGVGENNVEGGEGNTTNIPDDDFEDLEGAGNNDSFSKATNLGVLSRDEARLISGLTMNDAPNDTTLPDNIQEIDIQDIQGGDWFKITPISNSDLSANTVTIDNFDTTQGNLDLYVFNAEETLLGQSDSSDRDFESVSFDQTEGDVYIYVTGDNNLSYDLTIARRTFDIDGNGDTTIDDFVLAFFASEEGNFTDQELEQAITSRGLINQGADRSSVETIKDYVRTGEKNILDVDGNGEAEIDDFVLAFFASEEGNFTDQELEQAITNRGLINQGATRDEAGEIREFVKQFEPKTLDSSNEIENDELNGTEGGDILLGGEGDDTLTGGEGNDSLYGNRGNDNLTGGAGQDKFFIGLESGIDTIQDFESGASGDRLVLDSRLGFSNTNDVLNALVTVESNFSLTISEGNQVVISAQQELTAENIEFI